MKKDFQTAKGNIYIRQLQKQDPDRRKDIRQAIEALLREKLDQQDLQVSNLPSGKPVISHELEISIAHTYDTFAVYVSKEAVGIDIEYENPLIQKTKLHFMNAAELALFPSPSLEDLHLIWGAKEAIYKQYEGDFESLQDQVTIHAIDRENAIIFAETIHGETQCFYQIAADLYMVWT